jgi:uroporphyrinogen decarboxylase
MTDQSRLVRALKGETLSPPPIWMMRQAGRYLPEYRAIREKAGNFLDLCYTPELAVEVTLQPVRRFGFDAAILFSDILVVPHALGRSLRFEEGSGPLMTPLAPEEVESLDGREFHDRLEPVYETVRELRGKLAGGTALIGFCGGPWTVASYMIAGQSSADQAPARLFAYRHPEKIAGLLDLLADLSADYLARQIEAGADAVQIFESWAGVLDASSFDAFCLRPVARLVERLKARYRDVPVIGFPRGAGWLYGDYRQATGVDTLGLDWTVPLDEAARLQREGPVQGNLDPLRLAAGGRALAEGVDAILAKLGSGPLVFNLGHGVTPDTPPEHVAEMVARVRKGRRS